MPPQNPLFRPAQQPLFRPLFRPLDSNEDQEEIRRQKEEAERLKKEEAKKDSAERERLLMTPNAPKPFVTNPLAPENMQAMPAPAGYGTLRPKLHPTISRDQYYSDIDEPSKHPFRDMLWNAPGQFLDKLVGLPRAIWESGPSYKHQEYAQSISRAAEDAQKNKIPFSEALKKETAGIDAYVEDLKNSPWKQVGAMAQIGAEVDPTGTLQGIATGVPSAIEEFSQKRLGSGAFDLAMSAAPVLGGGYMARRLGNAESAAAASARAAVPPPPVIRGVPGIDPSVPIPPPPAPPIGSTVADLPSPQPPHPLPPSAAGHKFGQFGLRGSGPQDFGPPIQYETITLSNGRTIRKPKIPDVIDAPYNPNATIPSRLQPPSTNANVFGALLPEEFHQVPQERATPTGPLAGALRGQGGKLIGRAPDYTGPVVSEGLPASPETGAYPQQPRPSRLERFSPSPEELANERRIEAERGRSRVQAPERTPEDLANERRISLEREGVVGRDQTVLENATDIEKERALSRAHESEMRRPNRAIIDNMTEAEKLRILERMANEETAARKRAEPQGPDTTTQAGRYEAAKARAEAAAKEKGTTAGMFNLQDFYEKLMETEPGKKLADKLKKAKFHIIDVETGRPVAGRPTQEEAQKYAAGVNQNLGATAARYQVRDNETGQVHATPDFKPYVPPAAQEARVPVAPVGIEGETFLGFMKRHLYDKESPFFEKSAIDLTDSQIINRFNGLPNDIKTAAHEMYTKSQASLGKPKAESIPKPPAAARVEVPPPARVKPEGGRGYLPAPDTFQDITARSLAEQVAQKDKAGSPDSAYRNIVSYGRKAKLDRGQTWRGKVLETIEANEQGYRERNKPEAPVAPKAQKQARLAALLGRFNTVVNKAQMPSTSAAARKSLMTEAEGLKKQMAELESKGTTLEMGGFQTLYDKFSDSKLGGKVKERIIEQFKKNELPMKITPRGQVEEFRSRAAKELEEHKKASEGPTYNEFLDKEFRNTQGNLAETIDALEDNLEGPQNIAEHTKLVSQIEKSIMDEKNPPEIMQNLADLEEYLAIAKLEKNTQKIATFEDLVDLAQRKYDDTFRGGGGTTINMGGFQTFYDKFSDSKVGGKLKNLLRGEFDKGELPTSFGPRGKVAEFKEKTKVEPSEPTYEGTNRPIRVGDQVTLREGADFEIHFEGGLKGVEGESFNQFLKRYMNDPENLTKMPEVLVQKYIDAYEKSQAGFETKPTKYDAFGFRDETYKPPTPSTEPFSRGRVAEFEPSESRIRKPRRQGEETIVPFKPKGDTFIGSGAGSLQAWYEKLAKSKNENHHKLLEKLKASAFHVVNEEGNPIAGRDTLEAAEKAAKAFNRERGEGFFVKPNTPEAPKPISSAKKPEEIAAGEKFNTESLDPLLKGLNKKKRKFLERIMGGFEHKDRPVIGTQEVVRPVKIDTSTPHGQFMQRLRDNTSLQSIRKYTREQFHADQATRMRGVITEGEAGVIETAAAMEGTMDDIVFPPLKMEQKFLDSLINEVKAHHKGDIFRQQRAGMAVRKMNQGQFVPDAQLKLVADAFPEQYRTEIMNLYSGIPFEHLAAMVGPARGIVKRLAGFGYRWTAGSARTLKPAFDVSMTFIQGSGAKHTRAWREAWKPMKEAYKSKENYDFYQNKIINDPYYDFMTEDMKVHFSDMKKKKLDEFTHGNPRLEQMETMKKFQRMAVTFLNQTKYGLAKTFIKMAEKKGIKIADNVEWAQSTGKAINEMTGYGTISDKMGLIQATKLGSHLLWSQRLTASRINYLKLFSKEEWMNPNKRFAQKRRLASATQMAATSFAMMKIAEMMGAKAHYDPFDPMFGKVEFAGQVLDTTASFGPLVSLIARSIKLAATGEVTNAKGEKLKGRNAPNILELGTSYFENKLAPNAAFLEKLLRQKNPYTGKPYNIPAEALNLSVPFVAENAWSAWKGMIKSDPEIAKLFLLIPGLAGFNFYPGSKNRDTTLGEDIVELGGYGYTPDKKMGFSEELFRPIKEGVDSVIGRMEGTGSKNQSAAAIYEGVEDIYRDSVKKMDDEEVLRELRQLTTPQIKGKVVKKESSDNPTGFDEYELPYVAPAFQKNKIRFTGKGLEEDFDRLKGVSQNLSDMVNNISNSPTRSVIKSMARSNYPPSEYQSMNLLGQVDASGDMFINPGLDYDSQLAHGRSKLSTMAHEFGHYADPRRNEIFNRKVNILMDELQKRGVVPNRKESTPR